MGLAASQARLLMLTARKNDLEAQLQTISNEKLDLSRQTTSLSTEYANAMNATKLKFADTSDGSSVDMTYSMVMRPNNTVNQNDQYFLLDANGAVLLDEAYLAKLGLVGDGCPAQAFDMSRAQFLYLALGKTFDIDKCNYFDQNIALSTNSAVTTITDTGLMFSLAYDTKNFGPATNTFTYTDAKSIHKKDDSYASTIADMATSDWGQTFVNNLLGQVSGDNALGERALIEAAWARLSQDSAIAGGKIIEEAYTGGVTSVYDNANHQFIFNTSFDEIMKVDSTDSINKFVATFENLLGASECSNTPQGRTTNYFGTTVHTHTTSANIATLKTNAVDEFADVNKDSLNDYYEINYYARLYEEIWEHGWRKAVGLGDKSNLCNAIESQSIFLSKLNLDGSNEVYNGTTDNNVISSVQDEEAVTKAQAKYQSEKSKVDSKESILDMETTALDTERAEVSTDMESVQSILKSHYTDFKLFQNS